MGEPQTAVESKHDRLVSQIRVLCQSLGIRQTDLASFLGLKPSQVNMYMLGKVEMKSDRLLHVLEFLGIDVLDQIEKKISEAESQISTAPNAQNVLTKIGKLDAHKRESLFKLIKIMGTR